MVGVKGRRESPFRATATYVSLRTSVVFAGFFRGLGHDGAAADRLAGERLDRAGDRVLADADEGVAVADANAPGVLLVDAASFEEAYEIAGLGAVATADADEDLGEVCFLVGERVT